MRSFLFALLGSVTVFTGCLLPEYVVDKDMVGEGGAGGTGGTTIDLPPPPKSCNGPFDGGPTMVPMRGGYCMDSTEVTWQDYGPWATLVSSEIDFPSTQIKECQWNTEFYPPPLPLGCTMPIELGGELRPVVCVDWCDAYAYCQAMGKRLCGNIADERLTTMEFRDPSRSQWYNGCSSGGLFDYPYGETSESGVCHALGSNQAQSTKVGGSPGCQSTQEGYAGVFDLSGNVAEWEDACTDEVGQGDKCRVRGGSFKESAENASCGSDRVLNRESQLDYVGFRCCWDPP